MKYKIAVIKGDGVGAEIVDSAIEILNAVQDKYNHKFIYEEMLAGGSAYDEYGTPLPENTIKVCKDSDAVLFGAVGGSKWDDLPGNQRPEMAILGLRKRLGLFANLRPGILFDALKGASPLKSEIIEDGFNICVVRELTGGIYFGEKGFKDTPMGMAAFDMEIYSEKEIRRIAKVAFDMAMKRNKKLTSVDKSNVLESSRLWKRIVNGVAKNYPEVELNHMYVDNAAMQVVRDPGQFDVIVTSNMFGDILSDEISALTGSIGMLPSASLGRDNKGIYEPIHGSAPDIAGQNKVNPIATILSAAMMLNYSFGLKEEADCIVAAVNKALADGYRTMDIVTKGEDFIGTREMTELIKGSII